MADDWYRINVDEALKRLEVTPKQGLSAAEVQARLEQYGPNELVERGGRTPAQILIEQLTGILTLVLFGAAAASVFLHEYIDAVVILLIVILNAALGFFQEYRAEQSMAALKRMATPHVRARRDGRVQEIGAVELVPGDIVLLETGNVVPADGRVIQGANLRAAEAALTGESEAVDKDPNLVFETERALGDRRNMLYMGTMITYGRGEMLVTDTGMQAELGKIASMIQSVEAERTPLQARLDRLGKSLAIAALVIVVVIFALGVFVQGNGVQEMLLTAVSLAVAAIPEALTAVVTIALSLGAQRMLKRQALIRKLPAVETLGSVSVICSDKTGTLTQNRMSVVALDVANQRIDLQRDEATGSYRLAAPGETIVEASAQAPGELPVRAPEAPAGRASLAATLDLMLVGGALCTDAVLNRAPRRDDGEAAPVDAAQVTAVGDPTETALVMAAAQFGIYKDELEQAFPRCSELPFDSVRKRMTTLHRVPKSKGELPESLKPLWDRWALRQGAAEAINFVAITKGAVDGLLEISCDVWVEGELRPLDDEWRERILKANQQLAGNGMRVLGLGLRFYDREPSAAELESMEEQLIFLGLFGLIDPPRPEVREAIERCKTAGIRTVMITGDHPLTARHIARQLGMTENEEFLTGQELDKLSAEELTRVARDVSVFARVSPEHKLKLVDALRAQGYITAMTGDGVNDAPALKKADIGVAMGITGTDVSKEAAEMVLLDDNFATIVAAVEEGRIIYDNIRRFIKYLLSCNASEIAVMLIGPFLGMPLPLLPLQILWMNLVTDGLPALALGVEPAEENVMHRPPYSSQESIFGRGMIRFIVGMGIVMSLVSLGVGLWGYRSGLEHWQTLLFTTLIFAQLALALEVRSENNSLFHIGLFTNPSMVWALLATTALQMLVVYTPFFQNIFSTQALTPGELGIAIGAGLAVLAVAEVWKLAARR